MSVLFLSWNWRDVQLNFCIVNQANIWCWINSIWLSLGFSSSRHGDMGCHACIFYRSLTHTHQHTLLCLDAAGLLRQWLMLRHTPVLTQLIVLMFECELIFQDCHSLRSFSPVFNYWAYLQVKAHNVLSIHKHFFLHFYKITTTNFNVFIRILYGRTTQNNSLWLWGGIRTQLTIKSV